MPTDEQLRERFEEAVKRDCPAITADDFDGWDADTETYKRQTVTDMWLGWQARDAEVQALRKALEELVSIVEIDQRYREQAWAFAELDMARAALAGGEAGETE